MFSSSDAIDKSCGRVLHSLKVVELSIVQSTEQSIAEIKAAQNKTAHRSMACVSRQQMTNSADQTQMVVGRRTVTRDEAVLLHVSIEVAAQIPSCIC